MHCRLEFLKNQHMPEKSSLADFILPPAMPDTLPTYSEIEEVYKSVQKMFKEVCPFVRLSFGGYNNGTSVAISKLGKLKKSGSVGRYRNAEESWSKVELKQMLDLLRAEKK
jgi:hypothetical protein